MKHLCKNLFFGFGVGLVSLVLVFSFVLPRSAQSQESVQCESWLQELLTSQNGIQYILSNIRSVVAALNYNHLMQLSESALEQSAQELQEPSLQAVSIKTKITERNDSYHKFAWILVVENDADVGKSFTAKIQWLDADGFIVDDAIVYDLAIDVNEEKRFTGYTLVDAAVADAVLFVSAEIPERYVYNATAAHGTQTINATISK